jgi:sterol desaturase/sphingolipid hydroxylase (fatty acid hydroxylase superfamily)
MSLTIAQFTKDVVTSPFTRFFSFEEQTYWVTYLGAAACAAAYYFWSRRSRRVTLRGIANYIFPRKLFFHVSTKLDFKLFLLGSAFLTVQGLMLFTATDLADTLVSAISRVFGTNAAPSRSSLFVGLLTPLVLLLALEFGYWYAHYLMHRVRWLWEFHKVHHSAEVLTPLTEWRQHPVELLAFAVFANLMVAAAYAPIMWWFGPDAQMFKLWNIEMVLFILACTIVHLRHTHIKLCATGWLGCIVQSPAHHHIHHSTQKRHYDKNFGYCLSIWDWVFGTLYLPEKGQKIEFGLGYVDKPLMTIGGSLGLPFMRLPGLRRLLKRMKKPESSTHPIE